MTGAGWFMMILSCGFVLCLITFCFYRVLTTPGTQEHMHAPLDIDTHDTQEQ